MELGIYPHFIDIFDHSIDIAESILKTMHNSEPKWLWLARFSIPFGFTATSHTIQANTSRIKTFYLTMPPFLFWSAVLTSSSYALIFSVGIGCVYWRRLVDVSHWKDECWLPSNHILSNKPNVNVDEFDLATTSMNIAMVWPLNVSGTVGMWWIAESDSG